MYDGAMADLAEIRSVAEAAAKRAIQSVDILGIAVEPDVGMDGNDLLRVRIVVPDGQAGALDADQFFRAILSIKHDVKIMGDDRQTLVGFITPYEIEHRGDPEP